MKNVQNQIISANTHHCNEKYNYGFGDFCLGIAGEVAI
jgi:hypothetical protein